MKRIRITGLCLVALVAMSFAASSASAAGPVFYTKAEVGGTAPSKIPFTATLGAAFLEAKETKSKISCSDVVNAEKGVTKPGTAVGETTGPKTTENNVTTFTGCESSGLKCKSATATEEGVIITEKLKGFLGGISATIPGIRLYSQTSGRGGTLAKFECGGGLANVVVTGSVIGSTTGSGKTPAEGKFAASQKLTFAEAAGVQKYQIFAAGLGEEPEKAEQLTGTTNGTPEVSGQSVIATIKSVPASNLGNTL
jgi:hypothetical protein